MKEIKNKKRIGAIVGVVAAAAVITAVAVEATEDNREFRRVQQTAADTAANVREDQATVAAQQEVQTATDDGTTVNTNGEVKSQGNSTGTDIGAQKATDIALQNAGLDETKATVHRVLSDYENGVPVYEVEFYTTDMEYSYEIQASDGKVLQVEREKPQVQEQKAGNSMISSDEAKKIAQNHAKVSGDVHYHTLKLENEDGQNVYEIEFYQNGGEYEYEILASNGNILDYSAETR